MAHVLDPQVAGELGDGAEFDHGLGRPRVLAVDYVLDGPISDDLVQSYPVFLVTDTLADSLAEAGLTGFEYAAATVRPSAEYKAFYGSRPHRRHVWLRVTGKCHVDDCWLAPDGRLCVSDRMFDVMRAGQLNNCLIEPFETDER